MIKISVVSYLNAVPFVHGLQQYNFTAPIAIQLDTPNVCAQKLINNTIDIGLVPVAIIPQLAFSQVITNYCIGANGKVLSVQLFSNKPLHLITTIGLDSESNTSNKLCKLLCAKHWNITPQFTSFSTQNDANIIIGDRALAALGTYPYEYDLAQAWQELTGLPFVFAAWVANTPIAPQLINELNAAFAVGVTAINTLATQHASNQYSVHDYLTKHIQYNLTPLHTQAINLFLH